MWNTQRSKNADFTWSSMETRVPRRQIFTTEVLVRLIMTSRTKIAFLMPLNEKDYWLLAKSQTEIIGFWTHDAHACQLRIVFVTIFGWRKSTRTHPVHLGVPLGCTKFINAFVSNKVNKMDWGNWHPAWVTLICMQTLNHMQTCFPCGVHSQVDTQIHLICLPAADHALQVWNSCLLPLKIVSKVSKLIPSMWSICSK